MKQQKLFEEQQLTFHETQEKLNKMMLQLENQTSSPRRIQQNDSQLLKDMLLSAQNADKQSARTIYEFILKKDENYSDAYLGLYKLDYDIDNLEDFIANLDERITADYHRDKISDYGATLNALKRYIASCASPNFVEALSTASPQQRGILETYRTNLLLKSSQIRDKIFQEMLETVYSDIAQQDRSHYSSYIGFLSNNYAQEKEKIAYCNVAKFIARLCVNGTIIKLNKDKVASLHSHTNDLYNADKIADLIEVDCFSNHLSDYKTALNNLKFQIDSFLSPKSQSATATQQKELLEPFRVALSLKCFQTRETVFYELLKKVYQDIKAPRKTRVDGFIEFLLEDFAQDADKTAYCYFAKFIAALCIGQNRIEVTKDKVSFLKFDIDAVYWEEQKDALVKDYQIVKANAPDSFKPILLDFEQQLCQELTTSQLRYLIRNEIISDMQAKQNQYKATETEQEKKYTIISRVCAGVGIAFGLLAVIFLIFYDITKVSAAVGFSVLAVAIILTLLTIAFDWDSILLDIFIGALYLFSVLFLIFYKISAVGAGVGFPALALCIATEIAAYRINDRSVAKHSVAGMQIGRTLNLLEIMLKNDDKIRKDVGDMSTSFATLIFEENNAYLNYSQESVINDYRRDNENDLRSSIAKEIGARLEESNKENDSSDLRSKIAKEPGSRLEESNKENDS